MIAARRVGERRDPGAAALAALFLLIAATLAVYWRTLGNGFVSLDDGEYVTGNPMVRGGLSWEGVRWALSTFHAANWHPVTWLSHMLDCEWFGLDAAGHHAVSATLHAAGAALLYLALRRMTGGSTKPLLVAAFFALHPLRVESVAWVAERKDVLSGLFFMLSLLAYARYAARPGPGRYLVVLCSFALGLASKPMLVTLPLVLLLLDVWPLRRWPLRPGAEAAAPGTRPAPAFPARSAAALLLEKVPLLALTAASSAVTLWSQGGSGAVRSLETLPLAARTANALVAYAAYLRMTVWPEGLAMLYPHPGYLDSGLRSLAGPAFAAAAILLAITAVAVREARRVPALVVGWLWYLGALVPAIGIVQVGAQAAADRYTYLPSIGLLVAAVWGLDALAARFRGGRPLAVALSCLLLAGCCVATWVQIGYWRDTTALLERAIRVSPDSYLAHAFLGKTLAGAGRSDEAARHLREAVRLAPRYADPHNDLGVLLAGEGRLAEARAEIETAIRLKPDYAQAHANLGGLLARTGDPGGAERALTRALDLDPSLAEAHANLGLLRASQNRIAEALVHLEKARDLALASGQDRLAADIAARISHLRR